jgi:hypothetical protein
LIEEELVRGGGELLVLPVEEVLEVLESVHSGVEGNLLDEVLGDLNLLEL